MYSSKSIESSLRLLFLSCLLVLSCKKTTSPDSPPTITSFQPSETEIERHIGDVIDFLINASDSDEEDFSYKFMLGDDVVSSDNSFSWTVDEKGITTILGVAYNDLADTTKWNVSVENRAPQAVDLSLEMNEDEPKSIAKESLGTDPDGDHVSYRFLSGDHATFELEVGNLTFRSDADYFGSAYVEFEVSDGELADTGRVDLNISPINDAPSIEALPDTSGNEDEIPVGTLVHDLSGKIIDIDGDPITLELEQSNLELIRLGFNEDSTQIVVEYLQPDGNGSSDITLRATDPDGLGGEAEFTFTVNPMDDISGTITDLFNVGVPITNAIVQYGSFSDTTDELGYYSIQPNSSSSNRLIINHPDFYERQTSSFTAKDTTLNETMVEAIFNMVHYNAVCRSRGQTQRFVDPPTVYVDTSPALNPDGSTTPVPQERIDDALEVIADLPQFAVGLYPNDQVNVEIGTNPPWGAEDYIIFLWDNTISGRGQHYERENNDIIDYGTTKMKTTSGKGTMRQELSQNHGARKDSDLVEGIFNDPLGLRTDYSDNDLKIGKFLYSHPPGNASPDTDP